MVVLTGWLAMVPLTVAVWLMLELYLLWSSENSMAKVFSGFMNLPTRRFSCGLVKSSWNSERRESPALEGKSLPVTFWTVKSLPRLGWDTRMSDGA